MRLVEAPAVARAATLEDAWPFAVALAVVGPLALALVVAMVALAFA